MSHVLYILTGIGDNLIQIIQLLAVAILFLPRTGTKLRTPYGWRDWFPRDQPPNHKLIGGACESRRLLRLRYPRPESNYPPWEGSVRRLELTFQRVRKQGNRRTLDQRELTGDLRRLSGVNSDPRVLKNAFLRERKESNPRDPHVVLMALSVKDSWWCNCGPAMSVAS